MGERNVSVELRALPEKIEKRLDTLVKMGEFGQGDVQHCRHSYWSARDDWHKILIDCYHAACARETQSN